MKLLNLTALTLLAFLCLAYRAAAVSDPAITGATVNPAPITSSTGNAFSFQFTNNGTAISAGQAPSVQVTISLSKLAPHTGYSFATDISGTAASLFTWAYDSSTRVFTGTLNQGLSQFAGGTVVIGNLDVRDVSTIAAPANGANVNVVTPGALNSSTSNDNTSSYTYTSSGVVPLPVSLQYFSGLTSGCEVKLSWQTGLERSFSHFVLQRAAVGNEFSDYATIAAEGSNSKYHYEYPAVNGRAMYRLMMVDLDGSKAYSKTVSLDPYCHEQALLKLSPNPVVGPLKISIPEPTDRAETASATVYNSLGMLLLVQALTNSSNMLDMTAMPAGIYNIHIRHKGNNFNYKVVKQ